MNTYDNMVDAINHLKKRGFRSDYVFRDDKMECTDSGRSYGPGDMQIVEYHRFEGKSNPGDMSIVMAIECEDGEKGTLVSSYGTYADKKLQNFLSKVRIKEEDTSR